MDTTSAAEHLQVIRTLMERSSLYRRALAPIMIFCGTLGTVSASVGLALQIDSARSFIIFWTSVAVTALAGSFALVRRQAIKESERFWSPPTRRTAAALLPPLAAGFGLGLIFLKRFAPDEDPAFVVFFWVPLAWVVLYGCALCAAGFFTSRGLKFFGWLFIVGPFGLLHFADPNFIARSYVNYAYAIMGFFFGVLHIAYGVYLYLTENRKNAA